MQERVERPCAECHRFGSNSVQEEGANMSDTQQPKKHDTIPVTKCQVGEQQEKIF